MSDPRWRPIELNRQRRLMQLYTWGKQAIPSQELFETIALHRLTERAQGEYGVTYHTALGYAKVVLIKMRREAPSSSGGEATVHG